MMEPAYGLPLLRLEPIVMTAEAVFARTSTPPGQATLVTPMGVEHPLRILFHMRAFLELIDRSVRSQVRSRLTAEIIRLQGENSLDPVATFLDILLPAFERRNRGERLEESAAAEASFPGPDTFERLEAAVDRLSVLAPPVPSLWALGRIWLMRPESTPGSKMSVRSGGVTLTPSGDCISAAAFASACDRHLVPRIARESELLAGQRAERSAAARESALACQPASASGRIGPNPALARPGSGFLAKLARLAS